MSHGVGSMASHTNESCRKRGAMTHSYVSRALDQWHLLTCEMTMHMRRDSFVCLLICDTTTHV